MKTTNEILILSMAFMALSVVGHTDEVGNGGGAMVCRNPEDHAINHAELLDLWEGQNIYQLDIPRSEEDLHKQFETALSVIQSLDAQMFKYSIKMMDRFQYSEEKLPKNLGLLLTPDLDRSYIKKIEGVIYEKTHEKKNCTVEMVANYGSDRWIGVDHLKIDSEIFEHFSPTDMAAMYTHETLFFWARRIAVLNGTVLKDSRKVRELVANLYSTSKDTTRITQLMQELFSFKRPLDQNSSAYDLDGQFHQGMLALKLSLRGEPILGTKPIAAVSSLIDVYDHEPPMISTSNDYTYDIRDLGRIDWGFGEGWKSIRFGLYGGNPLSYNWIRVRFQVMAFAPTTQNVTLKCELLQGKWDNDPAAHVIPGQTIEKSFEIGPENGLVPVDFYFYFY